MDGGGELGLGLDERGNWDWDWVRGGIGIRQLGSTGSSGRDLVGGAVKTLVRLSGFLR